MSDNTPAAIQLNTAVQLPNVAAWQLTERTRAWLNVLWLPERQVAKLPTAQRRLASAIDWTDSHYARAKFRSLPDASVEDVRKVCRMLGEENGAAGKSKVVMHFDGRRNDGGGKSGGNQSFWLNDDSYSGELVEVRRDQVREWLGTERVIFVYDCDSAGKFLADGQEADGGSFYLAGCSAGEKLPAAGRKDLFSCVLSTPVRTAYEWHCSSQTKAGMIHGDVCDRQLLLGQLDWVLTLLTDAIAWSVLPRPLFEQLFRGDLLTGALFRRFMLAQRMLKKQGRNAVSKPALPDCSGSKLWNLWDAVMDKTRGLLMMQDERKCPIVGDFFAEVLKMSTREILPFIPHALTLSKQSSIAMEALEASWEQLMEHPQLQTYALNQAVVLVSSKATRSCARTISSLARIMAKNPTCLKVDSEINLCHHLPSDASTGVITKTLFLQFLIEKDPAERSPEHKQALVASCTKFLHHSESQIRIWSSLLLSTLVDTDCASLREEIEPLLTDPVPKVRAAALEAWIALNKQPDQKDTLISKLLSLLSSSSSAFLRKELLHALIPLVSDRTSELLTICKQQNAPEATPTTVTKSKAKSKGKGKSSQAPVKPPPDTILTQVWRTLNSLQTDPDPEVASTAQSVVTFVKQRVSDHGSISKKGKKKAAAAAAANQADANLPLPTGREPLFVRLSPDLLVLKTQQQPLVPVRKLSSAADLVAKENDGNLMNGSIAATEQKNPTLALLNHQLKSFQTQRAPELIRFDGHRQMAIAFKDRVVCHDDYTVDTSSYSLKPPSSTGDSSQITSLLLLPSDKGPQAHENLQLVGYNDGCVRLWQRPKSSAEPKLLTAWQALYDLGAPPSKSAGLLMTLSGDNGNLLVAGDAKYLRLWDLQQEALQSDVATGESKPVTALACRGGPMVATGYESGAVRLLDLRAAAGGKVSVGPKHGKAVRTISVRDDGLTVVSLCAAGRVHLLDARKMTIPVRKWALFANAFADVAIHQREELVACAAEQLSVYSLDGEFLGNIEREDGSQRVPACVAFHPTERVLCAGYKDNTAVVYSEQ